MKQKKGEAPHIGKAEEVMVKAINNEGKNDAQPKKEGEKATGKGVNLELISKQLNLQEDSDLDVQDHSDPFSLETSFNYSLIECKNSDHEVSLDFG